MRTVITVDETRETISFFGSTAAVEGWRVCIVDTVDELNPNAANALLKMLEEPPQQSLFLLVSHAPARVLPTILSRCRKLMLRPLATDDVIRAAAHGHRHRGRRSGAGGGRRGRRGQRGACADVAWRRCLKLQQRTAALLASLPRVDPRELHALGDALGISDRVALAAFIDSVDRWVGEQLRATANANAEPAPPCTAGGGMGKDRPRRARHRGLQSGTKTAGFLGVFAACGRDAVDAAPTVNPDNPRLSYQRNSWWPSRRKPQEEKDCKKRAAPQGGCEKAREARLRAKERRRRRDRQEGCKKPRRSRAKRLPRNLPGKPRRRPRDKTKKPASAATSAHEARAEIARAQAAPKRLRRRAKPRRRAKACAGTRRAATASTSRPRSPIRTGSRISATPMRRSPPTRWRVFSGSTARTCSF